MCVDRIKQRNDRANWAKNSEAEKEAMGKREVEVQVIDDRKEVGERQKEFHKQAERGSQRTRDK